MLPNQTYLVQQLTNQVAAVINQDSQLEEFFQFIERKVQAVSVPYKPEAVRAFYFSLFHNRDLNLAIALDSKLAHNLANDLALDLALARALHLALTLVKNPNLKQFLDFSFALEFDSNLVIASDLQQALSHLKQKLPTPAQGKECLLNWWSTNGDDWGKQVSSGN